MDAIPLVRASALLPFAAFLDQLGAPTEQLLGRANLSVALLNDPESLIPLMQSSAFVETAARAEGIDTLGILVGQQTQALHLGAFGQLITSSLTLYDLLTTLERTIGLYNSGDAIKLVWQGDALWFCNQFAVLAKTEHPQTTYYSLMLYLNIIRLVLGPAWKPPEIHLRAAPSEALLNLDEFAGVQVHFCKPCNAIKIPRACLSQSLPSTVDPYSLELSADAETLCASSPVLEFGGSLQQLIRSLLRQGCPDVALAAKAADMSLRSFQRRLTEADLSYSQLVEQVRFDLALTLLKQPDIKLIEIAAELGYGKAGNFTRAFKRWTGVSPREFRSTQTG
jgi:AraC-like DNA-binding protein